MDQLTPMEIKEAEATSERLEGEGVVKLYTKEEAVLGLVKIQNNDLKRGKTAVYDYDGARFVYYEVKEQSGKTVVEKQDMTRQMEKARTRGRKRPGFFGNHKEHPVPGGDGLCLSVRRRI